MRQVTVLLNIWRFKPLYAFKTLLIAKIHQDIGKIGPWWHDDIVELLQIFQVHMDDPFIKFQRCSFGLRSGEHRRH